MTITEARARYVEAAIHNGAIEGLTVSEATSADASSFIAGEIDADELVARVRHRYGLS